MFGAIMLTFAKSTNFIERGSPLVTIASKLRGITESDRMCAARGTTSGVTEPLAARLVSLDFIDLQVVDKADY